jgi:hypothetical protein
MAQQILPTDKTIHMGVKLVSTDGIDLPFKPFVLIPQDWFVLFESLATAARHLLARYDDYQSSASSGIPNQKSDEFTSALTALRKRVGELEKVWVPQPAGVKSA